MTPSLIPAGPDAQHMLDPASLFPGSGWEVQSGAVLIEGEVEPTRLCLILVVRPNLAKMPCFFFVLFPDRLMFLSLCPSTSLIFSPSQSFELSLFWETAK